MRGWNSENGAALIIALLMVSFLAIVGGGLLMSVTLDARVSLNYRRTAELLYMAEAGVEQGRESLRASSLTPSAMLRAAAGADGALSLARDSGALLTSDDVPLVRGVYLRNDAADGLANLVDSNGVVTLISIASTSIGAAASRKIIEVTLRRKRLPRIDAALMLDGAPVFFAPAASIGSVVSGMDSSGGGDHGHAIGVTATADLDAIRLAIPSGAELEYPGTDSWLPPPADVAVVDSALDALLKTPEGLERLTRDIESSATDVFTPLADRPTLLTTVGRPGDLRIVVVNGDCVLGTGDGFGLLLVRGTLTLSGNFRWSGLIFVIGQGEVRSTGGAGEIGGGLLLARTRDSVRDETHPLGRLLTARGAVSADFSRLNGLRIEVDRSTEKALALTFPYSPIARREY